MNGRLCRQCEEPLPEWKREDALHCSYQCKVQWHRKAWIERQKR